jgi:hypothetical protein
MKNQRVKFIMVIIVMALVILGCEQTDALQQPTAILPTSAPLPTETPVPTPTLVPTMEPFQDGRDSQEAEPKLCCPIVISAVISRMI